MAEEIKKEPVIQSVHKVLAKSYSIHFGAFLIGVFLDMIFQVRIFRADVMSFFGLLFLIGGTILIFWAQKTSRNLNIENVTKDSFSRGPYSYTRGPTHVGLFLLILGFGFIINALFVIILTIIAFLFSKIIFLKKEEEILEQKYGDPYKEYKKPVEF